MVASTIQDPSPHRTGLRGRDPVDNEQTTTRRPAHRPSRRDEVLAAGTLEFVERGFSPVSVTDIARRAGMTPAAVYYHFPTKEDVLLALVGRTGDAISELCVAGETGEAPDCSDLIGAAGAEDAVTALIDRFLAWLEAHPADARLYYQSSQGATADVESLRREQRRNQVTAMLRGPLKPAQAAMSATELRVVAIAVLVLFGEVTRLLSEGRPSKRHRDAVRAEAVDLGLRLVKP
jgi:AcrR family transcriptional regulator